MLRKFPLCVALMAVVVVGVSRAAASDDTIPPAVPGNLVPPDDSNPFLTGHAYGTQNYSCLPSGRSYAWILFGPQATLFDDNNEQIITHFLSANPDENGTPRPTWQHSRDTSSVWAALYKSSTDANYVAPDAIPWLLLQVVGAENGPTSGAKLSTATWIQRVNTAGGLAPKTGCSNAGDVGKRVLVPYAADYVFFK
jgi:uncharacterized protein DUF3455